MSVAETLKHVSLFAHLDDAAREAAAGLALVRRLPAGRILFREGEPASLLNIAPETLSRALSRLAGQDLVAVDGKVITFRRAAALEAVATGVAAGETEE